MMSDTIVYLIAGFACLCAFLVALLPNILHAVIALIGCLFTTAALYAVLGADLLAALQVMVYVGGTIVVIIFAVMMTPDLYKNKFIERAGKYFFPTLVCSILGACFWYIYMQSASILPKAELVRFAITKKMGLALVGPYALLFEYVSVVLLFGLLGAIVIARTGERR